MRPKCSDAPEQRAVVAAQCDEAGARHAQPFGVVELGARHGDAMGEAELYRGPSELAYHGSFVLRQDHRRRHHSSNATPAGERAPIRRTAYGDRASTKI